MKFLLQPLSHILFDDYLQKIVSVMEPLRLTSLDAEKSYLCQALQDQEAGNTYFRCIIDEAGAVMGAIQIRKPEQSRGQLYMWLHPIYWGKGIIQGALQQAAIEYFAQTGAPYFDATVDVTNLRSYKALKKAGFVDVALENGPWGKQFVLVYRYKRGHI